MSESVWFWPFRDIYRSGKVTNSCEIGKLIESTGRLLGLWTEMATLVVEFIGKVPFTYCQVRLALP